MNEWGFIGYETLAGLGKSTTINKFKQRCGLVVEERTVLSNPHSSSPDVVPHAEMDGYLKNKRVPTPSNTSLRLSLAHTCFFQLSLINKNAD